MKKLYDEIMALQTSGLNSTDFDKGYDRGLDDAAELAKKYDDEIDRLRVENKYLIEALEQIEAKVVVISKLMNL